MEAMDLEILKPNLPPSENSWNSLMKSSYEIFKPKKTNRLVLHHLSQTSLKSH